MGLVQRGWKLRRLFAVLVALGLSWAQAWAADEASVADRTSWADALAQPSGRTQARPLLVIPAGDARERTSSDAFDMIPLSAPPTVSPLAGTGFDAEMLKTFNAMLNAVRGRARHCGSAGHFRAAGPVAYDERLAGASLAHVTDMVERDYFAHSTRPSPEYPRGLTLEDRVRQAGYPWGVASKGVGTAVAEVIGRGYRSFRQILDGWLASPSHCAALMGPSLSEFGVAARFRPDDVPVWGMVLGRPPQ